MLVFESIFLFKYFAVPVMLDTCQRLECNCKHLLFQPDIHISPPAWSNMRNSPDDDATERRKSPEPRAR